ncbi:MAG TPA: DUF2148 domain-containing protein [Bacteroidales bacterium]|jgi:uncharacterized ferredoxin-like protein|nr:DUF2148 domain-containing protein [Bacteroidales bacterium]
MIDEEFTRKETAQRVADLIMASARTAPKARGVDTLWIAKAEPDEITILAQAMFQYSEAYHLPFFKRDAENILKADALILLGTRLETRGISWCSYCGFANCAVKMTNPSAPCAFNLTDLGIAAGAAAATAALHHVDNRIMFSVGKAAIEAKLIPPDVKVCYAIPLSISAKSPFFDR